MDGFPEISDVTQNETFSNYNGENRNKPQASTKEVQAGHCNENGGEFVGVSLDVALDTSLKEKEEESGIHRAPMTDEDPLVRSIISLQSAQEALEEEVRELVEIGREHSQSDNSNQYLSFPVEVSSAVPTIHEANLFGHLDFDEGEGNGFHSQETQISKLNEKGRVLESKLEEVSSMLSSKESRVVELEGILSSSNLILKKESGNTLCFLLEMCRDMEIELETLFKHKIEAEVEHLAIARTSQRLSATLKDRISLFEGQKSLAGEHSQTLHKLIDAEHKAFQLKRMAEGLEVSFEELLDTEEVLKLRDRVFQHTLCLFVQLMLLLLALLLILQLLAHTSEVVPT